MNPRVVGFVLSVVAAGLLAGCRGGPPPATVTGEVKVDGKPLEKGVISLVPADGVGVPTSAVIEKGQYQVQTTAGKKLVQISAPVVIEKRKESNAPNAAMVEITAESLPDKYHVKSELNLDVQPGANTKAWSLEGKKP